MNMVLLDERAVPKKYNCLLIDLDDTLVDFSAAERPAFEKAMAQFGVPADDALYAKYQEINNALWQDLEKGKIKSEFLQNERYGRLLRPLGYKANSREVNDFYLSALAETAGAIDGAAEFLAAAAELCTIAVVTNGFRKIQEKKLASSGLAPYVDLLFTSEEAGAAKPAPRFFKEVMAQLGITRKERILLAGDSLTTDIAGGRGFGIDTCWYNPGGKELPSNVKPTYVVEDYAQLLALLEQEMPENGTAKTEP